MVAWLPLLRAKRRQRSKAATGRRLNERPLGGSAGQSGDDWNWRKADVAFALVRIELGTDIQACGYRRVNTVRTASMLTPVTPVTFKHLQRVCCVPSLCP